MQQERLAASVASATNSDFNLDLHDWFELRAMLTTAEAVVRSALARTESRGAHQREDFPIADYASAQESGAGAERRRNGDFAGSLPSDSIEAKRFMVEPTSKTARLRVSRGVAAAKRSLR